MSNSNSFGKNIGGVYGLQPSARDADIYISSVTNGRNVLASVRARCKFRMSQAELAFASMRNKKVGVVALATA